jgi:hypothetical protein
MDLQQQDESTKSTSSTSPQQQQQSSNPNANPLLDVEIADENTSLNLLVSFLTLANKRGAFSLEEAHKIWECIKKFK